MPDKYMKASEAAELWGIALRNVQMYCKQGRIEGAKQYGRAWMIPIDAKRPSDLRYKEVKKSLPDTPTMPMPRKAPFLDMTDLYTKAGTADKVIESLADNPEAQALFAAEIAYSRGEIDKVITHANEFLRSRSGFYAVNAGGMLLALAAMWRGDIHLYREAKIHICNAPSKSDNEKDIMALSLACVDSAVRDLSDYPEWFKRGQFGHLPPDSHPAARVFYIKYLLVFAQDMAKRQFKLPDVTGLGLMKSIPYIVEPLLVQTALEKLVIPEIYLRLLVAVAYYQTGDRQSAILHIDRAIELALPDGLLGILVEHRRQLDELLDDRLQLANPQACRKYKELHKGLLVGWTKLHNSLFSMTVSHTLTPHEREISRLAAFGFTDAEIAQKMSTTVAAVKKSLWRAKNKTGTDDRDELGAYV